MKVQLNKPLNSPAIENFVNGNNNGNNNENNNGNTKNNNSVEQLRSENEELKQYLKIHGLYPQSAGMDMSKYVLKSSVQPSKTCPDMSKYVLKTSIPPPVRCPTINRDEWIRKSELPANWNKECPKHPDLTNYVLKSTIPPTQKCPPCICPKIKVNAGLCRQPNKDDCLKTGILDEACPKPKPCPIPKCPEPKACPEPPKLECPKVEMPKCPELKCPEIPPQGKCPEPERCPPVKDCPKCYDVKYMKVPVVKSEPLPKPEQETILPTNIIDTKLIRQSVDEQPRQPRIISIKEEMQNRNNNNNNNRNNNNNNSNNSNNSLPPKLIDNEEEPIASEQIFNNFEYAPAPTMAVVEPEIEREVMAPVSSNFRMRRNNGNNKKAKKCSKAAINTAYNKYGISGFNNVL
jgi:hypothetical protein